MDRKFDCLMVRTNALDSAIEGVHNNVDRVGEEKNKGTGSKYIVLNT